MSIYSTSCIRSVIICTNLRLMNGALFKIKLFVLGDAQILVLANVSNISTISGWPSKGVPIYWMTWIKYPWIFRQHLQSPHLERSNTYMITKGGLLHSFGTMHCISTASLPHGRPQNGALNMRKKEAKKRESNAALTNKSMRRTTKPTYLVAYNWNFSPKRDANKRYCNLSPASELIFMFL